MWNRRWPAFVGRLYPVNLYASLMLHCHCAPFRRGFLLLGTISRGVRCTIIPMRSPLTGQLVTVARPRAGLFLPPMTWINRGSPQACDVRCAVCMRGAANLSGPLALRAVISIRLLKASIFSAPPRAGLFLLGTCDFLPRYLSEAAAQNSGHQELCDAALGNS
jgi:hypothetical protein